MAVQRDSGSPKLIGATGRPVEQQGAPASDRPRRRISGTETSPVQGGPASPSPSGTRTRARPQGGVAPEERLALLEMLLGMTDPIDCAKRAIDWLCGRARVKQAMCALIEPDRARLVGVAGQGLSTSVAGDLTVDMNERSHKLVAVLLSGEPTVFRRNAVDELPVAFFGNASFMALPLAGELPTGLLLTSAVPSQAADDIRWLARVLGQKLARLGVEAAPTRAYELDLKVRAATAALIQQNEILNQQNELLNQQRLALEQASSLKSQFLANMSHEFRTPLNAILGYTSMLLQGMGGELNPQQTQMLTRVDSNGRNLLSLINDILDISRIEAGKMPIHFAEIRVTDIVLELLAELESMIGRSKLAVKTDLAELPALRTDRQKVKQILLNLITNALKFTPKGSVTISTAYDPAARQISVSVADTGIGISESDQAKLFNDFQQADSSPTRQYGGAGLGLSICRRLAAMLGGRIMLTSRFDQGSTFTLVLPRQARHR